MSGSAVQRPVAELSPAGSGQRERILAATVELLASEGASGVTMRTIGTRVGLHNSSLFHHFRSKGEIVAAILGQINEGLIRRFEPLAAEDPPSLEKLLSVLQDVSDHYAANRAEARCAMHLLLDPRALSDDVGARFTTTLWSWLARARAAGVIRPVAVSQAARNILGLVLMDPIWAAAGRQERDSTRDDERRRAELAAFVRGALAPT